MWQLKLFSFLILILDIILLGLAVLFVLGKAGKARSIKQHIENNLVKNGLILSLIISMAATLGSLYFSEILRLPPCKLCWYQRIFMYPQVVSFATAIITKTKDVFKFTLPLSLLGAVIALHHYYLQINPNPYAPCDTLGYSVSCSEKFTVYFSFITIPWMALTSFIALSIIAYLSLKGKKLIE